MRTCLPTRPSGSPVRLLLINPRFPESFWSFRWALQELLPTKHALNPPLGLATVAALTPPHWQITILDENVESLPRDPEVDIVGVGGMAVQHSRQRELLAYYRSRGYCVVAGGSYVSLSPDSYTDLADTIVVGEAERTWPRFCSDFEYGQVRAVYREEDRIDLEESPTPRFDLLKLGHYTNASVQFSRGCPFQCEFCDIPLLFGRRPRTKGLDQIGRELEALRAAGVDNLFFVDDNLIGHQPRARALLGYLADYQQRYGYPFALGTEASINLAADQELLALFRRAGFRWVFLGIETPDSESLAEAGKKQNLRGDLLAAVRNFYRNGIAVFSGFIVGFDHDTVASFSRLYRFIVDSGIQVAMLGLLTAIPGTPLYRRLEREGRLRREVPPGDNTGGKTNVIPLGMSYREMTEGYAALYRSLTSNRAIAARVRNKLRYFRVADSAEKGKRREALRLAARLVRRGILAGGIGRTTAFLWSLLGASPALWPVALRDWAYGLSIRAYAQRHLLATEAWERDLLRHAVEYFTRRLRQRLSAEDIQVNVESIAQRLRLRLVMSGHLEAAEVEGTVRLLRPLLRRVPGLTLVVQLKGLPAQGRTRIEHLLEPLRRYADRVTVEVDRSLLPWLDSNVFHVAAAAKR